MKKLIIAWTSVAVLIQCLEQTEAKSITMPLERRVSLLQKRKKLSDVNNSVSNNGTYPLKTLLLDHKYGHLKYMSMDQMKNGSHVDFQESVEKNKRDIEARLAEMGEEVVVADGISELVRVRADDPDDDDEFGQGGSIPSTLQNYYHLAYIGDIFIGTLPNGKSQQAKVIYDTATQWLSVTSTDCTKCQTQVYDPVLSSTVKRDLYLPQHEYYGSTELYGEQIQDLVCLNDIKEDFDQNTCASDFDFMALTDITGFYLPNFQGILGISPANPNNPEIKSYL